MITQQRFFASRLAHFFQETGGNRGKAKKREKEKKSVPFVCRAQMSAVVLEVIAPKVRVVGAGQRSAVAVKFEPLIFSQYS